jgi:mannose-6-phosphate isomerase
MKIYIDIDNTICYHECLDDNFDYTNALPYQKKIDKANSLYDKGHTIVYWTARGTMTGKDWRQVTEKQLDKWGAKYHELILGKPTFDIFIDDKNVNSWNWDYLIDDLVEKKNIRPWGRYDILYADSDIKVKKISVSPNSKLSYQSHNLRDEVWTITKGRGLLIINGVEIKVKKGDIHKINIKDKHRIINNTDEPLEFIETQMGDCIEEDIIRYKDDYGRS